LRLFSVQTLHFFGGGEKIFFAPGRRVPSLPLPAKTVEFEVKDRRKRVEEAKTEHLLFVSTDIFSN